MTGLGRGAEEVRASCRSEKRALRACRSRLASQTVSMTGAATRRPVSRSTSRSRNSEVEPRGARGQRRISGEREEAAQGGLRARRSSEV